MYTARKLRAMTMVIAAKKIANRKDIATCFTATLSRLHLLLDMNPAHMMHCNKPKTRVETPFSGPFSTETPSLEQVYLKGFSLHLDPKTLTSLTWGSHVNQEFRSHSDVKIIDFL
jgi:hypothetical protein